MNPNDIFDQGAAVTTQTSPESIPADVRNLPTPPGQEQNPNQPMPEQTMGDAIAGEQGQGTPVPTGDFPQPQGTPQNAFFRELPSSTQTSIYNKSLANAKKLGLDLNTIDLDALRESARRGLNVGVTSGIFKATAKTGKDLVATFGDLAYLAYGIQKTGSLEVDMYRLDNAMASMQRNIQAQEAMHGTKGLQSQMFSGRREASMPQLYHADGTPADMNKWGIYRKGGSKRGRRSGGWNSSSGWSSSGGSSYSGSRKDNRKARIMKLPQKGTIDIDNLPRVQYEDGSYSNVETIIVGTSDGKVVVIPTIVNGRRVSNDAAIKYYERTGDHLGVFDDLEEAEGYVKDLRSRENYRAREQEQQRLLETKVEPPKIQDIDTNPIEQPVVVTDAKAPEVQDLRESPSTEEESDLDNYIGEESRDAGEEEDYDPDIDEDMPGLSEAEKVTKRFEKAFQELLKSSVAPEDEEEE